MPSPVPCSSADLLSITGGDPLVRGTRGGSRGPAWRSAGGRAVAFAGYDTEDRIRALIGLGPPDETADLVLGVHHELPAGDHLTERNEGTSVTMPTKEVRVTVPEGTPLPLAEPTGWHFRAAYDAPPPQPAEARVAWCEDDDAITGLLRLVSPGTSAWPGDARVRRWAGLWEDGEDGKHGRLLACLADTTLADKIGVDGVGHVSAIAVHTEARGRALGPSITAWAMRRLFEEGCDVVTLGVYSDNAVALRMYDRLGFTVDHALTSGVLKETS